MASSSIWSPTNSEKFSFSPTCAEWALTTHDGRLAIWDAETGRVKQEFIPSAHLSSACTCLAWIPLGDPASSKKKSRKRKNSVSNGTPEKGVDHFSHRSEMIAVGTSSGSVLIYSLKTGDIQAQFIGDKGHSDRINDIAWSRTGDFIFTASSDGTIGQFGVKKSKALSKLQSDSSAKSDPVHSLCVHPSDRSLFSGSVLQITWWDLDTRSPLKTFVGPHLGAINNLRVLTMAVPDICYLVSSGSNEQDHTLSVWNLALEKSSKAGSKDDSIVARFSANETVRSISISSSDDSSFTISAVTVSGSLVCFDHNLTGSSKSKKKPVKPRAIVQIATGKDETGKVKSIPILDARLVSSEDDNMSLRVVHGTHVRPVFETLAYDSLEPLTCLVRQLSVGANTQSLASGSSNLVVPKTVAAHILAPGPSLVDKATIGGMAGTPSGRKRKQSIGDKTETLAMVDRLRLLSRDSDNKTTPPRADSMLQLLLQGLNNKDRKILDSVLDRADEDLIEKTVRKLPVEAVMPLVTELQHYIKGRGMVNQSHAKWLRSVLQIHTAHLMSSAESPEILGPVFAMLEARTKHYSSLLLLKGKLDLMTRQIVATADEDQSAQPSKEALLVYQDDSSDELSEVLDDLLLPPSDTEDIWQQGNGQDDDDDINSDDADEDDEDEDDQVEQIEVSDDDEEDDGESDDDSNHVKTKKTNGRISNGHSEDDDDDSMDSD